MEKIQKLYREKVPELTMRQAFVFCSIGTSSKLIKNAVVQVKMGVGSKVYGP